MSAAPAAKEKALEEKNLAVKTAEHATLQKLLKLNLFIKQMIITRRRKNSCS